MAVVVFGVAVADLGEMRLEYIDVEPFVVEEQGNDAWGILGQVRNMADAGKLPGFNFGDEIIAVEFAQSTGEEFVEIEL